MNLRKLAENNLNFILENQSQGFGWPITVINPAADSLPMTGYSNDISQVIDPDTGQTISGRSASVVLRISTLQAAGLEIPVGIADSGSKPWLITVDDINGYSYTFKVAHTNPDRTIGVVVCLLEFYG